MVLETIQPAFSAKTAASNRSAISSTTSATTSATGATAAGASGSTTLSSDFETFLRMLTVQMQNQDPLNPVDSSDYATQLATFSSVEQQVLSNDLLTSLLSQFNVMGMAQLSGWVGMEARAQAAVHFEGEPITLAPNPAAVADEVNLIVYDAEGNVVQREALPVAADPIEWEGLDENGDLLPDGRYSFAVESVSNGEVVLTEQAEVYARIVEARGENGETVLVLAGGTTVSANGITAIREPF